MTDKEIKKAVAEQLVGMIQNDVISECGTESFAGWVEGGDAFFNGGMEDEEDINKARAMVSELDDAVTSIVSMLGN